MCIHWRCLSCISKYANDVRLELNVISNSYDFTRKLMSEHWLLIYTYTDSKHNTLN